MRRRSALTLIELLVVLAILGVLMALMLPAIQKVRGAAARTTSTNNLRQVVFAAHNFADTRGGILPSIIGGTGQQVSMFVTILPFMEEGAIYSSYVQTANRSSAYSIRVYLDPADPTLGSLANARGVCSYAANAQVFIGDPHLGRSMPDGTSTTIALSQHYARDCKNTQFSWFAQFPDDLSALGLPFIHRASFADNGPRVRYYTPGMDQWYRDAYPITDSDPAATRSSIPGLTFQVRPRIAECDPLVPQSPHSALLVGYCDGSVRPIQSGVSEHVFWSLVTPSGGENSAPVD